MNEKTKWIVGIVAVLVCIIVALGGYWVGTWGRVSQSEYDDLRTERDGIIAEQRDAIGRLEGILGEAQGRANGLVGGLGTAVDLAGESVDRSNRIAILIDAIDGAIGELESLIRGLSAEAGSAGQGTPSGDIIP